MAPNFSNIFLDSLEREFAQVHNTGHQFGDAILLKILLSGNGRESFTRVYAAAQ